MKQLLLLSLFYLTLNALPFDQDQFSQPEFNGTTWVVLCASADGWYNYGIQADVYHAYQVIKAQGIPDENIIVFHYDDLANHTQNPTPGIVVNEVKGPDVYHNVPKHYTGKDVTVKNFLGALNGDEQLEKSGKKVVKSGPNDHVFVYLMDHGGEEIVAFPSEMLHAKDLNNALINMHKNNKFSKLVFYLEACESGSMFDQLLPNNINVYAITATKPQELGWFCNHDPVVYKTYLATYFAVNWLHDSEGHDPKHETLQQQFEYIKSKNNFTMDGEIHTQHAQQYGNLSIAKLPVSQFLGTKKFHQAQSLFGKLDVSSGSFVNGREVAIRSLESNIKHTENISEKLRLTQELKRILDGRQFIDKILLEYVNTIKGIDAKDVQTVIQRVTNRDCYQKFVDTFNAKCLNINQNPYVLSKLQTFVNICDQLTDTSDADIAIKQMIQHCKQYIKPGFGYIQ